MTHTLIALAALAWAAAGCVHPFIGHKKAAFREFDAAFGSLDSTPDLYEVVEIKQFRMVVVGSREKFAWAKAREARFGIAGYATSGNEIYLFGKRVNGKVVVNQAVLGHELNHLLEFKNKRFANPDKLEDLFK